jgi:hypothetical protein
LNITFDLTLVVFLDFSLHLPSLRHLLLYLTYVAVPVPALEL